MWTPNYFQFSELHDNGHHTHTSFIFKALLGTLDSSRCFCDLGEQEAIKPAFTDHRNTPSKPGHVLVADPLITFVLREQETPKPHQQRPEP